MCFGTVRVEFDLVLSNLRRDIFLQEPHVVHDAGEAPPDRPLVLAEVLRLEKGVLTSSIWVRGQSRSIMAWGPIQLKKLLGFWIEKLIQFWHPYKKIKFRKGGFRLVTESKIKFDTKTQFFSIKFNPWQFQS